MSDSLVMPEESTYLRHPLDFGILKNIRSIVAGRRELRHHRSLRPGLEPMRGVRGDGELAAGLEDNFLPDSVSPFPSFRRLCLRPKGAFTRHIEIDPAPTA